MLSRFVQEKGFYFTMLLVWLVLPVSAQAQQIHFVASGAAGANDGTSWPNAYSDLQDALASADAGDQIWVKAGLYRPDGGSNDRSKSFVLKSNVSVYGGFAGFETSLGQRNFEMNVTALSGEIGNQASVADNSFHVVVGSPSASPTSGAVLDGFAIARGNANGSGAQASGGGIYNVGGDPSFLNCIVSTNRAVGDGGGVFNSASNSSFLRCSFAFNISSTNGGGFRNINASPVIRNSMFLNNFAATSGIGAIGWGGGVMNQNGSPSIRNCVFMGNQSLAGSAFYTRDGASLPDLKNCTFTNNLGTGAGGAVRVFSAAADLASCILWGNSGAPGTLEANQITLGATATVQIHHTNLEGWTGSLGGFSNSGLDPRFVVEPLGLYHLQPNSPCIDSGDPAFVLLSGETDIDGDSRILGLRVDRGADEFDFVYPRGGLQSITVPIKSFP